MIEATISLARNFVRIFYYLQSANWDRVEALVTGRAVEDNDWYSTVRLHYRFDHQGTTLKGTDEHRFKGRYSARDWAATFPHNFPVTIRVNPKDPQQTRFFEVDQKDAAQEYGGRALRAVIGALVIVGAIVFVAWARSKFR